MRDYEIRKTAVAVVPKGAALFDERVTHVHIEDEAAGEFVIVRQDGETRGLRFDPEEWPVIREAIAYMIAECREPRDGR